MTEKGTCPKHGEFDLREGCPECIADRMAEEGNTKASIAEAIKATNQAAEKLPGVAPEPLSEEARRIITGGRDEMIAAATSPQTAVALRPGEDLEVRGYYEEALKLLERAESRVIATEEDLKPANDDLSISSRIKKLMEDKRKALLAPLKAQMDAIRATYDFLIMPVLQTDRITRDKMLSFNQEQERRRLEQEDINRKRLEAAQQEAALNNGEITESVNLVEVSPEVKRVSTEMGSTGMVDHWKYKVVDFALLPDAYKMADTAQLTAIAKRHHDQKQVPGVRFYNEPYIASRPR